jgi:hypothetical protein
MGLAVLDSTAVWEGGVERAPQPVEPIHTIHDCYA